MSIVKAESEIEPEDDDSVGLTPADTPATAILQLRNESDMCECGHSFGVHRRIIFGGNECFIGIQSEKGCACRDFVFFDRCKSSIQIDDVISRCVKRAGHLVSHFGKFFSEDSSSQVWWDWWDQ